MRLLSPSVQNYPWGSATVIPEFTHMPATGDPVAEMWFGAHPSAPTTLAQDPNRTSLADHIAEDPRGTLGEDVITRFGPRLPYLLKLISPDEPLSMQVHPNLTQARDGYRRARKGSPGAPIDYVDANHKPELIYALTRFEALCGFRAPRRAAEILDGLTHPVARTAAHLLSDSPATTGMKTAFTYILTAIHSHDVEAIASECADRLERGTSPSVRSDAIVGQLQGSHPGDRGVIASLLLNPVTLHPGEVMFVPAGAVHAYLDGFGVELMANSDNVLRAGLTPKNVDIPELLAIVDAVAAPPIRLAGEVFTDEVKTFYAPVDDFELSIIESSTAQAPQPVRGRGPRIVLALEDGVRVESDNSGSLELTRGAAVFVPASETGVRVAGYAAQADVP